MRPDADQSRLSLVDNLFSFRQHIVMKSENLFEETRRLSQALKQWGEALHRGLGVTAATRGVLDALFVGGAATVPGIARERGASRQHVQQLVDALLERELVERRSNPNHRRSSLIALTDKGRALVENMRAEERNAIQRIQVGVSDHAIEEAALVLAAWRTALWRDAERRAARL
jgi:DNA-binding MarR family transcriptional regulator